MNNYKIRSVLDFILEQGPLPTHPNGDVLSPDDMLVWFGLDERISEVEQALVKRELAAMVEAAALVERLRLESP